jgi:hypothetical protein
VAEVLTADSGLFAATPSGDEIEVDCQPPTVLVAQPDPPR